MQTDPPSTRHPARRPRRAALLILGVVLVVAIALARAGAIDVAGALRRAGVDPAAVGAGATPAARVEGPEGTISVFFTTPSLVYPDVARNRIPPPHERALLADVDAARRSVDVALYEYNLDSVADALVRATRRGVRVRAALDRENLQKPAMARWAGRIETAGATVTWERSEAFMHSKFVIVDERVVWTGSWNATTNDTYRNNNNLLRITAPAIVANYRAEFANFAADRFGAAKGIATPNPRASLGAASVATFFTPRDPATGPIVAQIERARRSVEFLAFSFTTDAVADAMIRRHAAGVAVRGVIERRNATGSGSEFARLQAAGVAVHADGNCYTMHHKVIIVDGRVVIAGSYNFTGRAEQVNDENMLIVDDPALARAYQQEFERVYAQALAPLRCQ